MYKKGERVLIQDGTIKRGSTVVKDGIDNQNRVRVRPDGIPLDMSISTIVNKNAYIIT